MAIGVRECHARDKFCKLIFLDRPRKVVVVLLVPVFYISECVLATSFELADDLVDKEPSIAFEKHPRPRGVERV